MNSWRFDPAQWRVISETAGISNYPAPIGCCRTGNPGRATDELRSAGVLLGPYLQPELHDALAVLTRPMQWIDCFWVGRDGGPIGVLGTAGRTLSAVAMQDSTGTSVHAGPADRLVSLFVAQLPAAPAGGKPAATLRAQRPPDRILQEVTSSLTREEKAQRTVTSVLRAERDNEGQLAANAHGPGGRRRSELLGWCDNTGDGRYLISLRGDELHIEPAGPGELRSRIDAVLAGVGV